MSVDRYFGRRYSPGAYNCLHFAADVWRDLAGEDIAERLSGLLTNGLASRDVTRKTLRAFRVVEDAPPFNCLVIMQRPRATPHIGVWIRGRVLHLQSRIGVSHLPLHVATFGYRKVRFFVPS